MARSARAAAKAILGGLCMLAGGYASAQALAPSNSSPSLGLSVPGAPALSVPTVGTASIPTLPTTSVPTVGTASVPALPTIGVPTPPDSPATSTVEVPRDRPSPALVRPASLLATRPRGRPGAGRRRPLGGR